MASVRFAKKKYAPRLRRTPKSRRRQLMDLRRKPGTQPLTYEI